MAASLLMVRAGLQLLCEGFPKISLDRPMRRLILGENWGAAFVIYVKTDACATPDLDRSSQYMMLPELDLGCFVSWMIQFWLGDYLENFPSGRECFTMNFSWDYSYCVVARLFPNDCDPIVRERDFHYWESMEAELFSRIL